MAYTNDNLVRYYIDASGSVGFGTNVVGTNVVGSHITWADSVIDLKLSKRYNVPFATTPPAIESIATQVAAWKTLRSVFPNEIPSSYETLEEDYKKAMKLLEELKEGEVDLPSYGTVAGAVEGEKGSSSKIWSNTKGYTPIFNVDSELNQSIDSDLLSDIEASRG